MCLWKIALCKLNTTLKAINDLKGQRCEVHLPEMLPDLLSFSSTVPFDVKSHRGIHLAIVVQALSTGSPFNLCTPKINAREPG